MDETDGTDETRETHETHEPCESARTCSMFREPHETIGGI
jgi:hypothetical protein